MLLLAEAPTMTTTPSSVDVQAPARWDKECQTAQNDDTAFDQASPKLGLVGRRSFLSAVSVKRCAG